MHRHIKPAIILWNFFSSLERKGSRPIFLPFWLCWRDIWFLSFMCLAMLGRFFFVTSKGMRYLQLAKSMIAIFHCVLGYFLSRSASCKTGRKKCWKKNPTQNRIMYSISSLLLKNQCTGSWKGPTKDNWPTIRTESRGGGAAWNGWDASQQVFGNYCACCFIYWVFFHSNGNQILEIVSPN